MRVLVCGGRDYKDGTYVWDVLKQHTITYLITGGARGVDTFAELYAMAHDISIRVYMAQWDKYGNAAGPIRNKQMLDEGKPDLVIAFPGGKGTANMVKLAKEARVKVIEIEAIPS
jgi:hypothetical protein